LITLLLQVVAVAQAVVLAMVAVVLEVCVLL
jgi:hypothetical protein